MSKQLTAFQKTFKAYTDKFELNHYRVTFCEEPLSESNAKILTDSDSLSVRIIVDTHNMDCGHERVAKHEAIHLLIAKFSELGEKRYVSEEAYKAAEEELVRKLEWLIPDIKTKEAKIK